MTRPENNRHGLASMTPLQAWEYAGRLAQTARSAPKPRKPRQLSAKTTAIRAEALRQVKELGWYDAAALAATHQTLKETVIGILSRERLAGRFTGNAKPRDAPRLRSVDDSHPLIRDNQGLIKFMRRRFVHEGTSHEARERLESALRLGLFHAAERFDERRDTKFSTYAVAAMRGNALRALHQMRREAKNGVISMDSATDGNRPLHETLGKEDTTLQEDLRIKAAGILHQHHARGLITEGGYMAGLLQLHGLNQTRISEIENVSRQAISTRLKKLRKIAERESRNRKQ